MRDTLRGKICPIVTESESSVQMGDEISTRNAVVCVHMTNVDWVTHLKCTLAAVNSLNK